MSTKRSVQEMPINASVEARITAIQARRDTEPDPLPRYRVLMPLVFGELAGEELIGVQYANVGDETVLYHPLRTYPEYVDLLIQKGAIALL